VLPRLPEATSGLLLLLLVVVSGAPLPPADLEAWRDLAGRLHQHCSSQNTTTLSISAAAAAAGGFRCPAGTCRVGGVEGPCWQAASAL
jgi:hypothetical protein